MNRDLLLNAQAWGDKLRGYWWKAFPAGSVDPVTLTWPVDPEKLREVQIRFPATYRWEPRRIWGDQIKAALEQFVPVKEAEIDQVFDKVVTFEAVVRGKPHRINVEVSDYAPLNEIAYENCDLHFKMEYSLDGYGERERLLPGGYVNSSAELYSYLPRLRRMRDREPPRYEVYGRYGLSLEKRRRPMEILRGAKSFQFYGGQGKVRYIRYLQEVARSKICIDLPSMSSITFRMLELLAVGSCIVGPPHTNQLLAPLREGVHCAYCKPDYSDLEEVCARYLEHEDERLALVRNSRDFFDAFVHRKQMASFWLHHIVDRFW